MINKKIKIAIVSHALSIPVFRNRWKKLSLDESYEVHLMVPKVWEQNWFGEKVIYKTNSVVDGDFHIHALDTTSKTDWGKYFFKSYDCKLNRIKPDIIYILHEESAWIHHQIYLYRKLFSKESKVIFFSMNARGVPYQRTNSWWKRIVHKQMWNSIVKNTDSALVHYPGGLSSLKNAGYNKPIYIQTQVGVDETIFCQNKMEKDLYKNKLGIKNKFILGYVGRLTEDKGVDDLLSAFISLKKSIPNLYLLLVGNGEYREEVEKIAIENKIEDSLHITGFVGQEEVPAYMNTMDVFVLGSKTTEHWIDTFPLVTVQAQSVGVPVIASDSASIPWQLSNSAYLYREGNVEDMSKGIKTLYSNSALRSKLIELGKDRSRNYFCHSGMQINFKKIIDQIISNKPIYHEEKEDYKQWKAYK